MCFSFGQVMTQWLAALSYYCEDVGWEELDTLYLQEKVRNDILEKKKLP